MEIDEAIAELGTKLDEWLDRNPKPSSHKTARLN
jgi:hypothetical protein